MGSQVLSDIVRHDTASSVLFLTNDFPPDVGGIQTFVRQLCDELPSERVVVYAPRHPRAAGYDEEQPFVVVRDNSTTLLPTPALARRVAHTAQEHGCTQVVYGASVPLGLLAPALRRAGLEWQVALTHGHEVWWAGVPGTRQALRKVAREVDVMTYVSQFVRDRLRGAVGGVAKRFVALTPRVDPRFHPEVDGRGVRRSLGIPADALVAICVARLVRRKGQDRLVRIWPEVLARFPGARLVIAGDGPDRRRLARMVRRRRLEARVLLVGQVDDVAGYYAAADVFAMPVRDRLFGLEVEGLGISFLEAAACGLEVVPGRAGGTPEAAPRPN